MRPPREDTEPWYKQFWPWFLISLPLSVVIASIVTINLAIKTNDGLVSDDYYKEGLAIHRDADSAARATALGIAADLSYNAETGALTVELDRPLDDDPGVLSLEVVHPTRPDNDGVVQLIAVAPGRYAGRIDPVIPADWKLSLQPEDGEWRVVGRLRVPGQGVARLD
jgi:hypothetical protein